MELRSRRLERTRNLEGVRETERDGSSKKRFDPKFEVDNKKGDAVDITMEDIKSMSLEQLFEFLIRNPKS